MPIGAIEEKEAPIGRLDSTGYPHKYPRNEKVMIDLEGDHVL
jgi:hypothetical protein